MPNVSGTVFGMSGQPLPGATVMITQGSVSFPEIAAITSETGRFEFGDLLVGSYTFSAFSDEGQGLTQITLEDSLDIIIEVRCVNQD